MRRRRNSPWGSTTAEYGHVRRSTKKRSSGKRRSFKRIKAGGSSGVDLGVLESMELEDGRQVRLPGRHLAWMPAQRALAITRKVSARPGRLSTEARKVHRQFHASEPQRAVAFEWPDQRGKLRVLGLMRKITYIVPKNIRSPDKRQPDGMPIRWVHAFGDHGESGHGPVGGREKVYPQRLMPALCQDQAGNLFIKRRPGNRFNVTDWIYW